MNIQPVGSLNVTGEQCCIRQLDVIQGSISPVLQPPNKLGLLCFIRLYENWPRFDACLFIFCGVLLIYRRRTLRWSGRTPLKTFSCVQEGQWSCRFHKRNTGILEVIFKVTTVLILHFELIQRTGRLIQYSTFEICMFFRNEMCY